MTEHQALPVSGYTAQSSDRVALVNENKEMEERLLRVLDALVDNNLSLRPQCDRRWLAIARTHFEEGFMALNRAVFQPQRVKLPEDDA